MLRFDHVTYQVPFATLRDEGLTKFMSVLGLVEVDPSSDILEEGYDVRWFQLPRLSLNFRSTVIHLCGAETPVRLGLGHICLTGLGVKLFNELRHSHWCEHDSGRPIGSPLCRAWLVGPGGLRVEVRP